MKIAYAILTHNEGGCIQRLIKQLVKYKQHLDEIVIVDDFSTDSRTNAILKEHHFAADISLFTHKLDGDFSAQKNYLISCCPKDATWIVNLDADELLSLDLAKNMKVILNENEHIDAIWVPRENKVSGITADHIKKWGWEFDMLNRINYPDYQMRIFKNDPDIKWVNKVHEKLTGFSAYAALPVNSGLYIEHNKTIAKQEIQNNYYSTLG